MEQIITSVQAVGFRGTKTIAVGRLGVADIILDGQTYKGFDANDEQVAELHPAGYLMHSVGVKAVRDEH